MKQKHCWPRDRLRPNCRWWSDSSRVIAMAGISARVTNMYRTLVRRYSSDYSFRTHTCGELRLEQVGNKVTLAGWVQAKRMDQFLIIRDRSGICQVRLPQATTFHDLPNESVVVLKGVVQKRPKGQENPSMATGEVEVELTEVLQASKAQQNLPIQQSKHIAAKEALRMKYRYLDLRNPQLQHNLMVRSEITMKMRQFLINKGFLDIETPTLFRRTPGGAKEFVVPTRSSGDFYSLVQSPQQFKQLLMVGGVDRYFQVARCYRDEGGKPDRQPEFTQLDLEISFAGREEVLALVEDLISACWPGDVSFPIPRMTYKVAMEQYGVDKPDTRYENTIQDLTNMFKKCGMDVIENQINNGDDFFIGGVFFDGEDSKCLKTIEKDVKLALADLIKEHKDKQETLIISSLHTLGEGVSSSLLKKCRQETVSSVMELVGPGKLGFLVCAQKNLALPLLGRFRTNLARNLVNDLGIRPHSFLWVLDFPMFVLEAGKLESAHHPFTLVHPEDRDKLESEPLACRSLHYDLVLDGQEVGGGSVRIHDEAEQRFVLKDILGEEVTELEHLLKALGSGAPPHAGIALGLDRLLAILTRSNSIKEVIAFPKSSEGRDLMSGAPTSITEEQYKLYHLVRDSS